MPLPKPKEGESKEEFLERCIPVAAEESENNDQATAICHSIWREGKSMNDELLKAIRSRQVKQTEFNYGILTADRYVCSLQDQAGLEACQMAASKGKISFHDCLTKAARTLVYANPDMVVLEKKPSLEVPEGIELPKNTLMVFKHVLTTSKEDRDNDILHSDGAEIDPKMLLLWQHVHTLPIGKMLWKVDQTKDRIVLVSAVVDINELAHDAAVMLDNDMGRFSHGFRALDFEARKDEKGNDIGGFDVKRFEVMEESLVSVAANTGADREEILLSLVEEGKLTSSIMKNVGQSIRSRRPDRVPVQWFREENQNAGNEGQAEGKAEGKLNNDSTPEETDGGSKEEGKAAGTEGVKYYDTLEGSFDWIEGKLREQAEEYLRGHGIPVDEYGYIYTLATYPSEVVFEVCEPDKEKTFYRIKWAFVDNVPKLQGDVEEVEVKSSIVSKGSSKKCPKCGSTNIKDGVCQDCGYEMDKGQVPESEKAGRVLSKTNETKIRAAVENIGSAVGSLEDVLSNLASVSEDGDKSQELSVAQAQKFLFTHGSAKELSSTIAACSALLEVRESEDLGGLAELFGN